MFIFRALQVFELSHIGARAKNIEDCEFVINLYISLNLFFFFLVGIKKYANYQSKFTLRILGT